jgi:hypothetical protein
MQEIDNIQRTIIQKEAKTHSLLKELDTINAEIKDYKNRIIILRSKLTNSNADSKYSMITPEVRKQLDKIKQIVPSIEIVFFLKMLIAFAKGDNMDFRYRQKYPHLAELILNHTIDVNPLKRIYKKHKSDHDMLFELKQQLLKYFAILD